MKAKVLKSFYPAPSPLDTTVFGDKTFTPHDPKRAIGVGQIIEVDASIGGPITDVYYKKIKLIVGKDVELIPDNKNDDKVIPLNKMTTKVRALRDLNLGGRGIVAQTKKKGDIFFINDNQPLGGGGKTLYYKTMLHDSEVPLVLGQDIELVNDNPIESIVTNEQKGSLLFYGGLLALGYIVYKIVTTK
jgi:hypothetical protein